VLAILTIGPKSDKIMWAQENPGGSESAPCEQWLSRLLPCRPLLLTTVCTRRNSAGALKPEITDSREEHSRVQTGMSDTLLKLWNILAPYFFFLIRHQNVCLQ
jgi:hypothetical protein